MIPFVWNYIKSNVKSIVIGGTFSLTGTGLSTYGFLKHDQILLFLGPIVATFGKIILGFLVVYPIIKQRLENRLND